MREKDRKDAEAIYMRKWMQSTMRRMKGRGKSDARCREMCCLHLPRGTGPLDRQGVATFSDVEVKHCRREYNDAVSEPQRAVQKDLYDLREIRKDLASSRQKLWHVAVEPLMRQKAQDAQVADFAKSLGGLHIHKEDHFDEEESPAHASPPPAPAQPAIDSQFSSTLGSMMPF